MYIRNNTIYNYNDFVHYMSEIILSSTKSVEQVLQFDSKYFKADPNLFRYDINLLSNTLNPNFIIKKLYLILKNKGSKQNKQYWEIVEAYKSNGFDIKTLYLCDLQTNSNIELNDMILIDDSICIKAKTNESIQNKNKITTYYINDISSNFGEVKKVHFLLRQLRQEIFQQHKMLKIFEPLSDSADINYNLAIKNCQNGIMSNGDCTWYHSVWQYLRVIDKVSSPEWHSIFYEKCFNKLFKENENPNILISGTADYSLLAYVYNSSKQINNTAEIFVLDTCKTPLRICEWYAERQGFKITVLNMNVLKLSQLDIKFDLICSDAFLTRFSKNDAKEVISNWYDALKERGMVVTTIRTREYSNIQKSDRKDKYIKDCVDRFQKWEGYFNISITDFKHMVEAYVNKMHSHDIGNKTAITAMFTNQGFIFDEISNMNDTPGEFEETTYYEICCRKE